MHCHHFDMCRACTVRAEHIPEMCWFLPYVTPNLLYVPVECCRLDTACWRRIELEPGLDQMHLTHCSDFSIWHFHHVNDWSRNYDIWICGPKRRLTFHFFFGTARWLAPYSSNHHLSRAQTSLTQRLSLNGTKYTLTLVQSANYKKSQWQRSAGDKIWQNDSGSFAAAHIWVIDPFDPLKWCKKHRIHINRSMSLRKKLTRVSTENQNFFNGFNFWIAVGAGITSNMQMMMVSVFYFSSHWIA